MRMLILVGRAALWATLGAGGLTALIVWRASPEMPMTWHIAATWFGIMWGLCAVLTLVMELLLAHLRLELGEVTERTKTKRGRPGARS